nr:zinc finger, CCHC-type [Tanacetum cinerariifolium]
MDSIMSNNSWVFTNLHPGYKTLGFKWIFKVKLKVNGTIEKFKARQVIQGFRQKSGIDYFDTYALVARISTIRLLIAMASIHNLIIHQMVVKAAFLNCELDDEVDMTKEFLSSKFSMKDIREVDVILGKLSRYTSNPSTQHWQTIQRDKLMQAGSAILKIIRLQVAEYSCLVEV